MDTEENGEIIDGDMIIYILSKYLKSKGKLNKNTVVGTRHTNMGLEKSLRKDGISLIRTDIGDKYVIAKLEGIKCRPTTSCPDQLAQALKAYKTKNK